MKENKGGRPTAFTKEVLDKLEQAYAMDCTDPEAALHAGVNVDALYKHLQRHPEFVLRKAALKNRPFLIARNTMMQGLSDDPDFAIKYMERKKKDEFSLKHELEHSGEVKFTPLEIDRGDN